MVGRHKFHWLGNLTRMADSLGFSFFQCCMERGFKSWRIFFGIDDLKLLMELLQQLSSATDWVSVSLKELVQGSSYQCFGWGYSMYLFCHLAAWLILQ